MPNGLIAVFQSCTRRNRKCYVIDKTSSISSSSSTPVATKPFFSYSNRVLFGGLSVQVQPHENKLLPPGKLGPEALRVSPVFHEANTPVQRKCLVIICDRFQFQLDIAGVFRAFDTGFSQSPTDPEAPVGFVHADTKLCAVPGLPKTTAKKVYAAFHGEN